MSTQFFMLSTLTMARYVERFQNLAWYASWESPVLSSVDVGSGSIFQANRFYDPTTGRVDFTRLRYSSDMPLWVWPPQGLRSDPDWPRGGLFLDGDNNGTFSRDVDYAFWLEYRSLNMGCTAQGFLPARGHARSSRSEGFRRSVARAHCNPGGS